MAGKLDILNELIESHHIIRQQLLRAGQAANDMEALFSLRQIYSNWAQSSLEKLVERQDLTRETLKTLEAGLERHFAYEEANLPPILGEVLVAALKLEHNIIRGKVREVQEAVNARFSGMTRDEIFAYQGRFQKLVDALAEIIEPHANKEDMMLNMAKAALEAVDRPPRGTTP